MHEDVLSEVFGFANVTRHPKTEVIDCAMMFYIEFVEPLALTIREYLSSV
jgi:hypothetical protein